MTPGGLRGPLGPYTSHSYDGRGIRSYLCWRAQPADASTPSMASMGGAKK